MFCEREAPDTNVVMQHRAVWIVRTFRKYAGSRFTAFSEVMVQRERKVGCDSNVDEKKNAIDGKEEAG
jgi:hypothetical protein